MNKYAKLEGDRLNEHLSNYLIEYWSVSGLVTFMRNEKAFEMQYIFRERDEDRGLSALTGDIYHKVEMVYFRELEQSKMQNVMSYDDLLIVAHREIEELKASAYYLGKAYKTVEAMKLDLIGKVNFLIENFKREEVGYLEHIQEIVDVETMYMQFVQISGEDFPLPVKLKADVVFITKEGKLAIFDHKSKHKYTAEEGVDYYYAWQAITYSLGVDAEMNHQVSMRQEPFLSLSRKYPEILKGVQEFHFYENKHTKNRDGGNQIRRIEIDVEKSRPLYEAMLLEAANRLAAAVSNPDYSYLMNPNDNFVDPGEMIDFWIKTRIEDPGDFPNIRKETVAKLRARKLDSVKNSILKIPRNVINEFRTNSRAFLSFSFNENMTPSERIEHRLKSLKTPLLVKVAKIIEGYSNDLYLLEVDATTKIGDIFKHQLDIASALGIDNVRIRKELVQVDSASYVGVEVNKTNTSSIVVPAEDTPKGSWKIPLGKDNFKNTVFWDLANPSTPHLLGAGSSGSGKSVAIRSMIKSLQAMQGPNADIIILDPKREFGFMREKGVKVIQDIREIESFMTELVKEMNEIFAKREKMTPEEKEKAALEHKKIIFFDEVNDAFQMMQDTKELREKEGYGRYQKALSKLEQEDVNAEMKHGLKDYNKKEMDEVKARMHEIEESTRTLRENNLILVQKARSAGYHFAEFAQRLSAKAMDGDAKVNFACRLCFSVPKAIDSQVILDQQGAETLNGKGDALFASPDFREPQRIQGFIDL